MAVKFSQTDFTQIPWEDIEMVGQWTMLHRDLFNVSWLLGRYCSAHRPDDVTPLEETVRGFNSLIDNGQALCALSSLHRRC